MALSFFTKSSLSSKSLSRLFALRFQSTIPSHPNHTDLSDDPASTDPLLRKLEDAIHRIIVRRSAPDWLPFLPGSSYWVPPPRSPDGSNGIAQLIEKLANPLTDEETLSTTTVRGWPSSDYFIKEIVFRRFRIVSVSVSGQHSCIMDRTALKKNLLCSYCFSGSLRSIKVKTSPTKLEAEASLTRSEAKASSSKSEAVATSSNESKSEDEEG